MGGSKTLKYVNEKKIETKIGRIVKRKKAIRKGARYIYENNVCPEILFLDFIIMPSFIALPMPKEVQVPFACQ